MKAAGMSGVVMLLFFVLLVAVLAAWLYAISLYVKAAKEKGYYKTEGAGPLWFVGIFATPLAVGLYVAALPDKRAEQKVRDNVAPGPVTVDSQLPEV